MASTNLQTSHLICFWSTPSAKLYHGLAPHCLLSNVISYLCTIFDFYKDDDSFGGGEVESGHSGDLDQDAPSTTILSVRAEVIVYERHPVALLASGIIQSKQEWKQPQLIVKLNHLKQITHRSGCFVSSFTIQRHKTISLATGGRSRRDISRLSNSLESGIIELPPIPPDWRCYSKTRPYL